MQKKFIVTYLIILVTFLIIMSLSHQTTDKLRGNSVSILSPFWEKILSAKHFIFHPFTPSPFSNFSLEEEKQRLQIENLLLQTENSYLLKQLNEQQRLSRNIEHSPSDLEALSFLSSDDQKMIQKKIDVIKNRLKCLPARVIFRSFDTWHNSLWVNCGASANEDPETPLVALNSPVVVGCAIVGIIDYVGKNHSRVRLITDNRLTPSVRACRGSEQDFLLNEQIEHLLHQLNLRKQISLSADEHSQLIQLLNRLKQQLHPLKKTWYLAKGVLTGSLSSSRIGQNIILKGTGFNYDFPDEEGESRDLRNGKSVSNPTEQAISILKINDILITTGMDGIFPPGFQVGTVTRIGLLKEGDYFYDLEAKPIAGPLDELALVFILPPLNKEVIPSILIK